MTHPRPLIVLGMARSGTTCVERAIAHTAGIVAPGEPFHGEPSYRVVWAPTLVPWLEGACKFEWISTAVNFVAPERLLIKVLYGQLSGEEFQRLRQIGDCVLCRRHPLWQLVSLRQAIATKAWNHLTNGRDMFGAPSRDYEPQPVFISRQQWTDYRAQWYDAQELWRHMDCRVDFPWLLRHSTQVCHMLAQRHQLSSVPMIVTKKLNQQHLSARIVNWRDVRTWFPWHEFKAFDEGPESGGSEMNGADGNY